MCVLASADWHIRDLALHRLATGSRHGQHGEGAAGMDSTAKNQLLNYAAGFGRISLQLSK
jgi:hypothetical protein